MTALPFWITTYWITCENVNKKNWPLFFGWENWKLDLSRFVIVFWSNYIVGVSWKPLRAEQKLRRIYLSDSQLDKECKICLNLSNKWSVWSVFATSRSYRKGETGKFHVVMSVACLLFMPISWLEFTNMAEFSSMKKTAAASCLC